MFSKESDAEPEPIPAEGINLFDQSAVSSLNHHKKKKQHIVMLDPGHGGKDPGAISKNGHYEKDLTLKMAKETRTLLEKAG